MLYLLLSGLLSESCVLALRSSRSRQWSFSESACRRSSAGEHWDAGTDGERHTRRCRREGPYDHHIDILACYSSIGEWEQLLVVNVKSLMSLLEFLFHRVCEPATTGGLPG